MTYSFGDSLHALLAKNVSSMYLLYPSPENSAWQMVGTQHRLIEEAELLALKSTLPGSATDMVQVVSTASGPAVGLGLSSPDWGSFLSRMTSNKLFNSHALHPIKS